MQTKYCPDCKQSKIPEGNFYKNRSRPDGFGAYCKACTAQRAKPSTPAQRELLQRRYAEWSSRNCRKAHGREYYKKNREFLLSKNKKWREENKELYREIRRKWVEENVDRLLAAKKKWNQENVDKVKRYSANRRAALINRTPGWLTPEDFQKIDFTYLCAYVYSQESGVAHHVDHILPLQGKYVSGLHVPSNLQVLTGEENLKKSNKWTPE